MKKMLAILLLIPALVLAAAPTFTATEGGIKIACAATTCDAPTLVTEGLAIQEQGRQPFCAYSVIVEAASAMTAGGKVLIYIWNPYSALANKWAAYPDGDCTITAVGNYACTVYYNPVHPIGGRITAVGSGIGLAHSIYVTGQLCK
jgi:hypothetical protein